VVRIEKVRVKARTLRNADENRLKWVHPREMARHREALRQLDDA